MATITTEAPRTTTRSRKLEDGRSAHLRRAEGGDLILVVRVSCACRHDPLHELGPQCST